MRIHTRLVSLALLLTSISMFSAGCSSAQKRAEKLFEDGLFFEAAEQYQSILKEHPEDTEALQGLKRSRDAWIDRGLIDVRLGRQSGKHEGAADLLMLIMSRETEWKAAPASKAAFTQREENSYFIEFALKRLEKDWERKQPLRAEYFIKKYSPILTTADQSGLIANVLERTRSLGSETCKIMISGINPKTFSKTSYFYRGFLIRYCDHWQTALPASWERKSKGGKIEAPADLPTFYTSAHLQGSVAGLSAPRFKSLELKLGEALGKTAWFEPMSSSSALLPISGQWSESHDRTPHDQRHVYFIDEPYTKYVQVEHERSVPETVHTSVPDSTAPGGVRHEDVTHYRTEKYITTEQQTAFRQVDRVYTYVATFHDQKIGVDLSIHFDLQSKMLDATLSEKAHAEGLEHQEHQPSIGLNPVSPKLIDVEAWWKEQSTRFTERLQQALATSWIDRFCGESVYSDPTALAEATIRCARQKPWADTPYTPFTEAWFQAQFGVSVAEAETLVPMK